MRKHIFRDCISLILVVAMMFSISINVFAANNGNKQINTVKEISQSLKVKTEDTEVEKPLVSVCVANADLKEPAISIAVNNTFLQKCPELLINVSCDGKKDAIYEDVLYIGKEVVTIKGLTTGTKYYITAQGTHDISVDNFVGYFILHEKNDELSVEYKITHETQMIREYNETYIRELKRASELLQEANDKYSCYNKEEALLDDRSAPFEELEVLDYAATLLAEYAAASVRYEVEPNNTMAQADRVYDDDTTYGTIGYSGDVDYYKVQFTSDGNANFWLGDIPSGQDYDFYLYNASGTLLRSSTSTSNQEQIYNYPVTANTWYYMKVIGYNGAYNASSYYRVRAKNYPTVQSGDSYEPNNTFSAATGISNTATITSANIHTTTDVDYYRFTIPSTSSISISLSNIPTNCDYELVLYNSSQTQCGASYNGGNSSESITYTASPGTYYIKVYSYNGSSSSNYRLALTTSASYSPDAYEPNNTFSTATSIANTTTIASANIHTTTDIDYYKFVVSSSATISISLSNIPTNCDYELVLYNSSQTQCGASYNGGNSSESITYTASPGTYYIKVYSYSGSSSTAYRMSLSSTTSSLPTSVNLTCTVNPKIPANANASTGTTTLIKNLPIKIYTITNTGAATLVATGKTSSAGVFTKNNISVGSNVTSLRASVTFEDTTLSVQNNSGVVYTFNYSIPIGNSANISVSLPNVTTIPEDQVLAYGAWKNGQACIESHNAISSTSLGTLVLRSEVGDTGGSYCSGTQFIHLNGSSADKDYLDVDVIQHEMGHWLMSTLNVMPSGAGGNHSYSGYYTNALAYSEGWATFYSCAARNSSQMMDYFTSSSSNYGADLSNAKYYQSSAWHQMLLHDTDYSKNQTNELNAGTVLWAYKGLKDYSTVQSILSPTKSSMQAVYNAAITNATTSSEKEAVWNAFNNRGCAFDTTAPTASMSISGTTAYVTASDNISVKKLEWYVNGNLVKSRYNVSSDSLSLSNYSGNITVEVRVYDPEGLAAGARPRTLRYTSIMRSVYLSSAKGSVKESDLTNFEDIISTNVNTLIDTKTTLSVAENIKYTFHTDGYEDISIFSHILGGIEMITIYNPDGTVYDTIAYISPDAPYVIENAQSGDWTVEVSALSRDNVRNILAAAGIQTSDSKQSRTDEKVSIDDFKEAFETPVALSIVSRPANVTCSGTIYTNNPSILLEELSGEKYIFVYSNGKQLDYTEALPDGVYELELIRKMDGLCSDIAYLYVTVDTVAPQITFDNECETYEEGIFLHGICSKDTIEVWMNGEYVYMSDIPDFGVYLELAPGEHTLVFELYDRCGNKTTEEIVLRRY